MQQRLNFFMYAVLGGVILNKMLTRFFAVATLGVREAYP